MKFLSTVNRSAIFGNLEFPTRQDYVDYFLKNKIVETEKELWENIEYVSIIHQHWHGEGRNGCIFALLAAKKSEEFGWQNLVITKTIEEIENNTNIISLISHTIKQAINDPDCEILSLLFSNIITDEDLVRLIKQLLTIDKIFLIKEEIDAERIRLAMRIPLTLNTTNVLSWLMAFGPFYFLPLTRQSAITEIAIRVKLKPSQIFKRLSKDADAAHLADLPMPYHEEVMEKIWQNTLKRTRDILGEEPNEFSAAKTTFTLPKNVWEKFK